LKEPKYCQKTREKEWQENEMGNSAIEAKKQMMLFMQEGFSWQEAGRMAGIQTSRSTAYRWFAIFRAQGEAALQDGRHGHPVKVRNPVRAWLQARCQSLPSIASSSVQRELEGHFGVKISITHLNRVRAASGLSRREVSAEKNQRQQPSSNSRWQEGAGSLLLLAAAHETGLLSALETALVCSLSSIPSVPSRLLKQSPRSRRCLLQVLLFLGVFGLRRTWDLRSYTGDALSLLTGRKHAYGYFHTERFLAEVAQSNCAEMLTTALAKWTTRLWQSETEASAGKQALFYIDGHRKPVYTDTLIPRGLVGRLSTILGSRALVLLYDAHGHPLLATTHRGDQHLTIGLPAIVKRYEQETSTNTIQQIIVGREGMAAEFLAYLLKDGRTVISVLRTDQYAGLDSFTDIGDFLPLRTSPEGKVLREVAPASIALPLPEQKGQSLQLRVALIRDLCHQVPLPPSEEERDYPRRWDADLDWKERMWWEEGWQATPSPAPPTVPKLIPIVSTAETIDAVELAETYTRRWPLQENIIRDFLLPLGLDGRRLHFSLQVNEVVRPILDVQKRRVA